MYPLFSMIFWVLQRVYAEGHVFCNIAGSKNRRLDPHEPWSKTPFVKFLQDLLERICIVELMLERTLDLVRKLAAFS